METKERFIGVDISKARLDVGILPGQSTLSVANNPAGIKKLVRRQLVNMIVAESNRRDRAPASVLPDIEDHIQWLEQRLKEIEKQLAEAIERTPEWRETGGILSLTAN